MIVICRVAIIFTFNFSVNWKRLSRLAVFVSLLTTNVYTLSRYMGINKVDLFVRFNPIISWSIISLIKIASVLLCVLHFNVVSFFSSYIYCASLSFSLYPGFVFFFRTAVYYCCLYCIHHSLASRFSFAKMFSFFFFSMSSHSKAENIASKRQIWVAFWNMKECSTQLISDCVKDGHDIFAVGFSYPW